MPVKFRPEALALGSVMMALSGLPCGWLMAAQRPDGLSLASGDKKPFLVIMVDTKQSVFTTTTETVSSWIFPSTTNCYTMQDWIGVNFGGRVGILPCNDTCDTADDGVVKVAVDSTDPTVEVPGALESICKTALLKAAPYIDFSRYDKAKTRKIRPDQLGIVFLFANPDLLGGATSFGFYEIPEPRLNGVQIDGFEFVSAAPSRDNIGAIIHEWIHLCGESDFYACDQTRYGVNNLHLGYIWKGDLKGRNGPSNLMPLSMENFGIVKPEVVSRPGEYELRARSTGKYNYLKIPTADLDEYFLLENRQFDGFDDCIANDVSVPGIAIYHVDRKQQRKDNFNNDDRNHRLVTIEAANEATCGYNEYNMTNGFDSADHNVLWHQDLVFGPATVPGTSLYSGKASGISITVTSRNGSVMKVRVGLEKQRARPL